MSTVTPVHAFLDVRSLGALGDGTHDDSAAINSGLASLATTGGGTLYFPGVISSRPAVYLIKAASLSIQCDNVTLRGDGYNYSVIKMGDSSSVQRIIVTGAYKDLTVTGIGFEGNFINNTYIPLTLNNCIDGTGSIRLRVLDCRFHGFGGAATDAAYTQVISLYNALDTQVRNCFFVSNIAYEININSSNGLSITDNTFGVASLTESRSNIDWWDTYAGGLGTVLIGSSNVYFAGNRMFGGSRPMNSGTPTGFSYLISSAGGLLQMSSVKVQNNEFHGLGNSRGTVQVTNGSGTITGTLTYFWANDVGRTFMVEGDGTIYTVTAWTSATSITVSPVIARGSASGLRYLYQNSGDAISIAPCNGVTITGNVIEDSGDNSIDIIADDGQNSSHVLIANNRVLRSQVAGLYIGGVTFDLMVANNIFVNNCRRSLPGHKGAIEISPSDQGSSTPSPMWHMSFFDNQFIDDQATTTQLSAFQFEAAQVAHIFSCSERGSHIFGYVTPMTLYDASISATQWAAMFNYPTTLTLPAVPTYADNAAALAGGLVIGTLYRITGSDHLAIVH